MYGASRGVRGAPSLISSAIVALPVTVDGGAACARRSAPPTRVARVGGPTAPPPRTRRECRAGQGREPTAAAGPSRGGVAGRRRASPAQSAPPERTPAAPALPAEPGAGRRSATGTA